MEYQFEPDLQGISDAIKNAGYTIDCVGCITTHIKNEHGEAINAYVEPISLEASLGQEKIVIGFYLKHEREKTKITIKSYSSTRNLNEIGKELSDIILGNCSRN